MDQSLDSSQTSGDNYELMHKNLLNSMNAYAVVLSILATISYGAFFQPPQLLHDNGIKDSTSLWQKLFFYFNGFSFFASICALLFFASSSFSPLVALNSSSTTNANADSETSLKLLAAILPKFVYLSSFLALSLTFSVVAYIFAGLSIVSGKISERLVIIITGVIGGFVYLQSLWICVEDVILLWQKSVKPEGRLWKAVKQETRFGSKLIILIEKLYGDRQST